MLQKLELLLFNIFVYAMQQVCWLFIVHNYISYQPDSSILIQAKTTGAHGGGI